MTPASDVSNASCFTGQRHKMGEVHRRHRDEGIRSGRTRAAASRSPLRRICTGLRPPEPQVRPQFDDTPNVDFTPKWNVVRVLDGADRVFSGWTAGKPSRNRLAQADRYGVPTHLLHQQVTASARLLGCVNR